MKSDWVESPVGNNLTANVRVITTQLQTMSSVCHHSPKRQLVSNLLKSKRETGAAMK